jgi:hypothetical protein
MLIEKTGFDRSLLMPKKQTAARQKVPTPILLLAQRQQKNPVNQ